MSAKYEFQGWVGHDKNSASGQMVWEQFQPKEFEETDVDIKITHCGICGSDVHTLRSGWAPTSYPCVVGHEIVGHIVRAGSKTQGRFQVGDRVGVGAQSQSCLRADCEQCSSSKESYCQNHNVGTYNGKFNNGDKSFGGYANYWRGPAHFVVKIPEAMPSEIAAPLLCGGITAFSPLKNNGAGPGKKVGVIGIGGLGHMGLLGAKALGCEKIVAISRSSEKKQDALAMGANDFIATEEDKQWNRKNRNSLDLIVCTVSSPKMPLRQYLQLLRPHGQFIQVGAPEEPLPPISAFHLIGKGVKVGGSQIGSPKEIQDMLDLYAQQGVKTWSQAIPMKDANKAIVDMEDGKARYRYVLVNPKESRL